MQPSFYTKEKWDQSNNFLSRLRIWTQIWHPSPGFFNPVVLNPGFISNKWEFEKQELEVGSHNLNSIKKPSPYHNKVKCCYYAIVRRTCTQTHSCRIKQDGFVKCGKWYSQAIKCCQLLAIFTSQCTWIYLAWQFQKAEFERCSILTHSF